MKKMIISLLLGVAFLLVGCNKPLIEVPVNVPDGEDVTPPVTEPEPEPETPEPVEPTEPEKEVQIVIEYVDVFVEVPAEVEFERKYEPGTYFASSENINDNGGYSFVVVVIDSYGDIAGVHIDETYSSRLLYRDIEGDLYVYIEGDSISIPSSYRKIDKDLAYKNYPVITDAITTNDLIDGIHTSQIKALEEVQVNETKVFLNGDLNMGSDILFNDQLKMVEEKIMQDNTTYGFNLYRSGDTLRTDSVAGVSIAVSEYLELVQGILDIDAKLKTNTELLTRDNPVYGVYEPGTYVSYSDRVLIGEDLNFGVAITVVDDFGSIAGVYLDETANNKIFDGTYSTKGIMGDNFGLKSEENEYEWYEQASRISDQIVNNQGVDGIQVYSDYVVSKSFLDEIETSGDAVYFTDAISGIDIRVDRLLQAAKKTLVEAIFTGYQDGIYFMEGSEGLFGIITIKNNEIEDIYVDRIKTVFQAQYELDGEEYDLYTFIRAFEMGDTNEYESVNIYEKEGVYYSSVDLFEIQGTELSSSSRLEKDEEVELSQVEKASLVIVPGNYTAKIAGDSEYVNLAGWTENNEKLMNKFIESNGTHTVFLENGNYIVDEDILYYDVSYVLELINGGLYQARTGNPTFEAVGNSTSKLLADGEYFYSSTPSKRGEIEFGYMIITDGNISSLYFDKTFLSEDGTSTLFVEDSGGYFREQMVTLVDVMIENQNYLVNKMLDDYVYYEEDSINSISDDSVFEIEGFEIGVEPYTHIFKELIDLSVNERLTVDAKYIAEYLGTSEDYYKDLYFRSYETLEDFLPVEFATVELANEYELEWITSNDRDLDLENPENGYDVEVDEIDEDKEIYLTMNVRLPGTDEIIYQHTYLFDILTRSSEGRRLLSRANLSLPSNFIIEDTAVILPNSNTTIIRWASSDQTVMTSAGLTLNVDEDTEITLTAYADIDDNGMLSDGEPFKEFNVTVLTTENAIRRVRDSIELSTIYQYIDHDFRLSNESPVWGVTYTWNVFNPYIVLTEHEDYTDVRVIRTSYDANVTFTADINVGSANNDVTKQYKILEGTKAVFEEYAHEDIAAIDFGVDLKKLIVGDDLMFDDLLQGLIRNTIVQFEVNDFEMFINLDGEVIANHPNKDAEFTLTVSSRVMGQEAVVKEYDICVLSDATIYDYVLTDMEILSDYTIDLSHNQYLDVEIQLPLEGYVHESNITWTVEGGVVLDPGLVDTSRLNEGIITILTKTGTETILPSDSFTLTAEVSLGDKQATKNIEITLRD